MTNQEFLESITQEGEEWRDVVGFEGYYMVSSFGRLITLKRQHIYRNPNRPKFKAFTLKKTGYFQTMLQKDNVRCYKLIHRLVAEAFIPNPDHLPQIDHIDRNRENNHASNLRWCTLSGNMHNPLTVEHCRKLGKSIDRSYNHRAVVCLTADFRLVKKYDSLKEAVADGFRSSGISNVCQGRNNFHHGFRWMYLSDYEARYQ